MVLIATCTAKGARRSGAPNGAFSTNASNVVKNGADQCARHSAARHGVEIERLSASLPDLHLGIGRPYRGGGDGRPENTRSGPERRGNIMSCDRAAAFRPQSNRQSQGRRSLFEPFRPKKSGSTSAVKAQRGIIPSPSARLWRRRRQPGLVRQFMG